jgi:hypothetical protein
MAWLEITNHGPGWGSDLGGVFRFKNAAPLLTSVSRIASVRGSRVLL